MSETGQVVYDRTYSRTKPDGTKETWPETVERVVDGNLALVDARHNFPGEREALIEMMTEFEIIPAGRHLWATGVKNAGHIMNCWASGWADTPSDHFEFTFMRLMEGGGVGANYSNYHLEKYPPVVHPLRVEIVCDPGHPDYQEMFDAGVLSEHYSPDWGGAFVIEDSREGWAAALVDLIDTHYRDETVHYQRVYDVSRIRPAGAKLKTFGGQASGPFPFAQMLQKVCKILSDKAGEQLSGMDCMDLDHAIAQCVVAGGVRRSARMAMMHWADPQIEQFINCKSESGSHWTTNISVEVDSWFWGSVNSDADLPDDQAYSPGVHARKVLKALAEGAVRNGEPGMWDSSLSNVGEPNVIYTTNPCGEITLEAWEPCNLGHVNLAAFVDPTDGYVDFPRLRRAHRLMTRFLIRATFSEVADPKSREVLDRNRRIGVGHLGVASYLAMTNTRYSRAPHDWEFTDRLGSWAATVNNAARDFCHELRIPVPVKLRTIAPTGTVAKMPGVSEGIHPIFSKYFVRRIRFNKLSDAEALQRLVEQGYEVEDDLFAPNTAVVSIPTKDGLVEAVEGLYGTDECIEAADDLTLAQLFEMQALYQQEWADNAVSFTANVDPEAYTAEDVAATLRSFGGKLKGSTIFPEASFPQAPYERITREQYEASVIREIGDGVDEECSSGACPIR